MKRNILYIIGLSCLFASCVEEKFNDPQADPGKEVRFSVTVEEDLATKTIYGEESTVNGVTSVPVNWIEGDKISVYGETCYIKQAEYEVKTGGNVQNFASSLDKTGSAGVQWGDQPTSDFYAVYPSTNASFKTTDGETLATTSISSTQNNVFELSNGTWVGKHFGNDASNPSMHEAIMYARTEGASPIDKNGNPTDVKLHFKPFTTVLKFRFVGYTSNLSNPTVYVQNITVTAPDGVAIAGKFDLDIEGSGSNASATAVASKTKGETSNTISVNTILPGGTYLPLKPNEAVEFNVFTIPQGYSMNGTDKLWTVTINTQGHGSFTYKMKPLNNATYNLVAGQIHKVKVPNLQINTKIDWNPENWITQIPTPVYVSELSLPGAWYCTNSEYQSTTDLETQYKAGIRAFNIDCRLTYKSGRSGEMDLYCAGSESSFLGSITSPGKTVLEALQEISPLIPENEYVVVVLTIAEKPKEDSGTTLGTVNPKEVLKSIADLITNNGSDLGVYGCTESTLGKTITPNTTINEVLDHMIVKVNANTIATANTELAGVTGFLNYATLPNALISYASMAPATNGDIVIGVYDRMQTSPIYWGSQSSDLDFHYHQAQRTTYSGTYEEEEWSWEEWKYVIVTKSYEVDGVPTYEERKKAIDDIILKSTSIYDAGTHNAWFQIGIGGSRKNSNDSDNASSRSEIAERLNPYLYGKIVSKMDIDPSPVGIVLMNYCTDVTDYTTIVNGTSYTASSIDLVKAIIEMNGKFYLNRQGNSVTTGGTNDSGSGTTNPSQAKNGAYAVVGDNAF